MCSSFTACSASSKVLIANAQSTACLQAACTEGECCTLRIHNDRAFTYEFMCGAACASVPHLEQFCFVRYRGRRDGNLLFPFVFVIRIDGHLQLLSLEGALWRFHTSEQTFTE